MNDLKNPMLRFAGRLPRPVVVGLCGRAGAGKDTAANALEQLGFVRLAFADVLRREIAEQWRLAETALGHDKERPLPGLAAGMCRDPFFKFWAVYQGHAMGAHRSPRWAMTAWGDYRRSTDPAYFVRRLVARAEMAQAQLSEPLRFCITDVRYPNEHAALGDCLLLRIKREGADGAAAEHSSEDVHRLQPDVLISNDGTAEELQQRVRKAVAARFGEGALAPASGKVVQW